MRYLPIFVALALLAAPIASKAAPSAEAQTNPAQQPAAPAKTTPTIIPGSPLAALTGAGTQPPPENAAPAPFGTDELGFAMSSVLGYEATRTFNDFTDALQRSTRLTPVLHWLQSFSSIPWRRAYAAAVLRGIAIAILPGIALDVAARFLLGKPMRLCARHGVPQHNEYIPDPDMEGLAEEATPKPRPRISLRASFRRLGFALLNFGLALLPIAGFAITEQLFLSSGLLTVRAARLAVTGIANAYLLARLAQEIVRLPLSPAATNLRLVRLPTSSAAWAMRRANVLIGTIFAAFCIISVAEILALPKDGAGALLRLAALAVHLEIALAIWQSRRVISRWITGRPDATGFIAGLRHRFAKIWYVVALFYVLALWVAWAGGVHNALGVLLRAILVVLAALVLVRLAWSGSNTLLGRLFPDPAIVPDHGASKFLLRAGSYNPLLRLVARTAIGLLALLLILQGWGINAFGWLVTNPISHAWLGALSSVAISIAVAILIWEFINYHMEARVERLNAAGRPRQAMRLRTLLPILRAGLGAVIVVVTLIICLSRIGVNATGLLAVSSVVGIAVGFGSQKLVQDIITGLFLLFEDALQVGDVVSLAGMSGTVERVSIRTIRLRAGDGSINIIPFSSVTIVTNQTRDFSYAQISIMVGFHENIERVTAVLKEIGAQMRAEPAWAAMMRDDLQLFGLDSFSDLGLVITGQIRTGPGQHWSVRREFYGRVQKRFAEEGIELPSRNQSLRLTFPPAEQEQLSPAARAKPDLPSAAPQP
ncbi:MAG: mechanosensitive ion channel family protein [Rhodospirillales bacterium]|nr:mechanosensitive ion channel family protein [Rhodospirillales bacterium]